MPIADQTAKQLRATNPQADDYHAAVEYLFGLGWQFKTDLSRKDKPVYSWGWWVHPENTRGKNRPCGDPGDFHFKAWDAVKAYVAQ